MSAAPPDRAEALWARLVGAMPHGAAAFRLDEGGALILAAANPAASRISGVDLGARLGQPFADLFPVSTLSSILREAARTQTESRVEPLVGPDGRAFTAAVVPLGDGAVGALFTEIASLRAARVEDARERPPTMAVPVDPARAEPASPLSRPQSSWGTPESVPRRSGNILVIDDEPLVGRLVERALGRGHRVTALITGREGLDRLLAGERFDLILCDLMMPELTGMDLYERVLELSADQAERMVFLTGGAFTRRAREFLQQRPFLEKPFDLSALEALVEARVR